jgi:acetylornithine deacetylase/succinyl-diaminopimelate desuccinylase family protein
MRLGLIYEKELLLRTICELISIPSRNPPGEEERCALYIKSKLEEYGIEAYLVQAPLEGRPQVVGVVRGDEGKTTLILNGHMDVVPEGDVEGWRYPPFEGKIVNGRIYGRGACDMKSSLGIMIEMARVARSARLSGNLVLTFAAGEEKLEPGTQYLLKEFLPKMNLIGQWGVVLEPTSCNIGIAEGGGLWSSIAVKGKATQSSVPEKGINAISKASKVISKLDRYNAEVLAKKRHPLGPKPTVKVTMINGGIKDNIIPDLCNLVVDRRLIPGETTEEAWRELRNILEEIKSEDPEFSYEMSERTRWEPAEIPFDSGIVRNFMASYEKVIGNKAKIVGMSYGTDMRNFVNDTKIPAVIFGPGDVSKAHSPDEFIEIDEVEQAMRILLDLIERLLRG